MGEVEKSELDGAIKRHNPRTPVQTAAEAVVTVVNPSPDIGPGYNLKRPCAFDFYEGESDKLDWKYMKDVGPLMVIWQATYGWAGRHWNGKMDYGVAEAVEKCNSLSMRDSMYHLMIPGNASRQADFFISTVRSLYGSQSPKLNAPPMLDVEIVNPPSRRGFASDCYYWLSAVEDALGVKSIVYTNKYYFSFLNYPQQVSKGVWQHLPPPWANEYWGLFAGYPFMPFLDANETMPDQYRAWGFNKTAGWQYYDKGRSNPPRGFPKKPWFPANDLCVLTPEFVQLLHDWR